MKLSDLHNFSIFYKAIQISFIFILLGLVSTLFIKYKEISIENGGITFRNQLVLFYLLGLNRKSFFIDFIYLQTININYGLPIVLTIKYFNLNRQFKIEYLKLWTVNKKKIVEFDQFLNRKIWGVE